MTQVNRGNIKPGTVIFMSTEYNGTLTHSVIVGRTTGSNVYYYAHTTDRNAADSGHGLLEYFNSAPKRKNGYICAFYVY